MLNQAPDDMERNIYAAKVVCTGNKLLDFKYCNFKYLSGAAIISWNFQAFHNIILENANDSFEYFFTKIAITTISAIAVRKQIFENQ